MAELFKFTPALEPPANLQKFLVGRESLVKRLLAAIDEARTCKSLQHFLLIGPRGIGKTHLLLLVYHTVRGAIRWNGIPHDLSKFWEPVLLSEEQYGIASLAELLGEVLVRLKDQAPSERLTQLLTHLQRTEIPHEAEREMILEYLRQRRSETGKRILLLLDNLQMILGNFSEEDQSRLRSILISYDLFMIIGSAPTLFNAVLNYQAPFYNFFEIVWLKEISQDEIEELLKKRLEHDKHTDILSRFDEYRPRIRAIVHLTSGNPRLILSLYQIFTAGEILEVEQALLRLLDGLTPYFQDRMGQLSPQQRKVIEAMALMDGPATPVEISQTAHLPVNTVTSQLKRLEKVGCVRSHKEKGKRETLYDISDQLFRLWRQMRVEAGRRRLGFIVKFLKIWFTEEEIIEIIVKSLQELAAQLQQAEYEPAKEIIDKLYYYQEVAPAALQPMVHLGRAFGLINTDNLAEAERELQEQEARVKTEEEKELLSKVWNNLGVAYARKREYERAVEAYRKALEHKPDVHEAWNNLGVAYAEKREYERAIEAYRKAVEHKPDDHEAWYNLGVAYAEKQEYERAIEAYTKALETIGAEWLLKCRYLMNRSRAFFALGRKNEALKDAEEAHRLAAQHQYSEVAPDAALWLLMLQLDLSQEQVHQGNETKAFEHYKKALEYLAQGASLDQAQDALIAYFKGLLRAKALRVAEKALSLLEAQGHEWVALMHPYRAALNYLKTKDKSILNRLFPEIRQIVEEMVALAEGKQEPRPK